MSCSFRPLFDGLSLHGNFSLSWLPLRSFSPYCPSSSVSFVAITSARACFVIVGTHRCHTLSLLILCAVNAHQILPEDDISVHSPHSDIEKVDFPSFDRSLPTYDAEFESHQGPRRDRDSMEKSSYLCESSTLPMPQPAITRSLSDILTGVFHFRRENDHGSTCSCETTYSYSRSDQSHSRSSSQRSSPPERWVIE